MKLKLPVVLLLLTWAALATTSGLRAQSASPSSSPASSSAAAPRHVVMISIDGLMPSTYTQPGPSRIPTLRRLAREGASAEGVIGVLPTVTYPSHTTLITGVLPAVHGIPNNLILDTKGIASGEWYRYARDIQAPTLPGAVRARGLTAAAVSWPVSVGMDVDYLVPEYGWHRDPKMLHLMREISRPSHLLDAFEIAQGQPLGWPFSDAERTAMAIWMLKTYRPALTLLHIFETDSAQHEHGPGSPEALKAIEDADANVQKVLDAIAAAGIADRTDVVIVSDHGFLPIAQQLQLNYAFKQEKLLDVDAEGRVTRWDAYFYPAGGSGFVLLRDPKNAALRDRVGALLAKLAADPANGIERILGRDALDALGAEPRASFAVDMKSGFYSGVGHTALLAKTSSKGGHGFGPDRRELHASLIMHGPDVPKGVALGVVRMTQIAPTIASWFDVGLSPKADTPLPLTASPRSSR